MDAGTAWYAPLIEKALTALGAGLISGIGVLGAAWRKRSSRDKQFAELRADMDNMQQVQTEQAAHLATHDATIAIYAEDREQMRQFNRDIGVIQGRQQGDHRQVHSRTRLLPRVDSSDDS